MFEKQRFLDLERAQALTIAEGDLLRDELGQGCRALVGHFSWVGSVQQHLPQARPLLIVGAAAAGFLFFRNLRPILKWLPTLLGVLRFARAVGGSVRRFSGGHGS